MFTCPAYTRDGYNKKENTLQVLKFLLALPKDLLAMACGQPYFNSPAIFQRAS